MYVLQILCVQDIKNVCYMWNCQIIIHKIAGVSKKIKKIEKQIIKKTEPWKKSN
jgi:hypothetical protein